MIIATHPGRHGDVAWSLPSIRALAQASGEPVHLRLSAKYGTVGFCALLRSQPYLASVEALEGWQVEESAPIGPRVPPECAFNVFPRPTVHHLGYDGWPTPDLPRDVYRRVAAQTSKTLPELDLHTPWITVAASPYSHRVVFGWSDEHFELKFGLTTLVEMDEDEVILAPHSRWIAEAVPVWRAQKYNPIADDWIAAAQLIASAKVFVGCCSALHVLAVGLGIPAIVMEPNANRLNSVFWPLGQDGPQVTLVRGNDGLATWDSRHCGDAIRAALEGRR